MSSTPWEEGLTQKTVDAQKRLEELQRQQEELQREQIILEELKQKQREVKMGRREMVDKFKRSLASVEREEEMFRHEIIQIQQAREAFTASLDSVQEIAPEHFDSDNLQIELSNALSSIEQARDTFSQYQSKVKCLRDEGDTANDISAARLPEEEDSDSFALWFRRGLAFSMPLLFLGLVWMSVFILKK